MIFTISKHLKLHCKNTKQKLLLNKNSVPQKTLLHLSQKINFYEENQLVNRAVNPAKISNAPPPGRVFYCGGDGIFYGFKHTKYRVFI